MLLTCRGKNLKALESTDKYRNRIKELEKQVSELKFTLDETRELLTSETEKRKFYQFVADFTFGWELWFEPDGSIKYISPSGYDLTGFTSNQVIASGNLAELLVYQPDRIKFNTFLEQSLNQSLLNQSLEFRILTRTRQLRWCIMNVRGVYDRQGKYLGIRASIDDITKLKKAMGQILELETVRELHDRTRHRLQSELNMKERELVSILLQLSQKNELLTHIRNQLQQVGNPDKDKDSKIIGQIVESIGKQEENLDWSLVENELEKIHPGFFGRLMSKHASISLKDKRLCGYVRLGLTSREIAGLLNMNAKSVEIARIRLRKKLKLSEGTRLSNYLLQL